MKELWKDIVELDNNFSISNTAKIKSKSRFVSKGLKKGYLKKERILSQFLRQGYLSVTINYNGKKKALNVHRVFAKYWVKGYKEKLVVNHKNGINTDNRIENLEWCTVHYNNLHAKENNLLNPPTGKNHAHSKIVLNTMSGIFYESASEAIKSTNLGRSYFYKRLSSNMYNFHFVYV